MLASLPEVAAVLKDMTPPAGSWEQPLTWQYLTVLFEASLINRMVAVPAVEAELRFVMVRSLPLFAPFTLPLIVT